MIYVFLAPGFEEMEAVITIDMLRRADCAVTTAAVSPNARTVIGSHGIPIVCDKLAAEVSPEDCRAVVLPGGMPGTKNLEASPIVQHFLDCAAQENRLIAAICAAPLILGHKGLLQGKNAVCFPGFEPELHGASLCDAPACRDGSIITGKGAGTAVDFAAALIAALRNPQCADNVKESMQCPSHL